MIVKFFNRGTGGGSGPVDYLLGKDRDREFATLNQGDPNEIIDLINSVNFKQKYKSGCLSFFEKDLSTEMKNKIMKDFEMTLLPGIDKNQYSILWVEHLDKERLELNFVIPCVELITGKRLQPYYHAIDSRRIDTWKRCINTRLDLHDPDAPENKRSIMDMKVTNLPKYKKQKIELISNALLNNISVGLVKNRSDVVRTLEDAGFTISRQTDKTISIKDPDGGKNIKLKGAIYEKSFDFSEGYEHRLRRAQELYNENKASELSRNRKALNGMLARKSEQNKQLYHVNTEKTEVDIRRPVRESGDTISAFKLGIRRFRERCDAENKLSNELSNIQNAEIKRSNHLNYAGIHGWDGRVSLLDGGDSRGERSKNISSRDNTEDKGVRNDGGKRRELSEHPKIRSGSRIPKRRIPNMEVKLDDRVRETFIDRIGRALSKSRNYVSRIKEYFRELDQSLRATADVLHPTTERKSGSDSVSKDLDLAAARFSDSVRQSIRAKDLELKELKSKIKPKSFHWGLNLK